ncbi:MAG: hypothetical protein HZA54_05395, partial [Planctomycetes bacterium]|nr:hypothetical protein [Planctomycetota bacterium]
MPYAMKSRRPWMGLVALVLGAVAVAPAWGDPAPAGPADPRAAAPAPEEQLSAELAALRADLASLRADVQELRAQQPAAGRAAAAPA